MTVPWPRIAYVMALVLLLPGMALADGGGGGGGGGGSDAAAMKKQTPEYTAGVKAIDSKDFARAIPLYEKALRLDPRHLGAHEYIGEAYLDLNDLPKAKEHLARLNKLCFFTCEEYRDLKKAVQAYEKAHGEVKPAVSK